MQTIRSITRGLTSDEQQKIQERIRAVGDEIIVERRGWRAITAKLENTRLRVEDLKAQLEDLKRSANAQASEYIPCTITITGRQMHTLDIRVCCLTTGITDNRTTIFVARALYQPPC